MSDEIKVIAVDIDGTLLNSKHELTTRVEKALRAAVDKDVRVVLTTGKTRVSANWLVERLGLTTPGVFLQGLAIYEPDGTVRYQQTLDVGLARQVITFAEDRGFTVVVYSGPNLLMHIEHPIGETLAKDYHEPKAEVIGPLQNVLGELPVNKLVLHGPEKRIKALRWQLSMQLNGAATLVQAQVPTMLEVLPPGASKGAALKRLLKDMGVSPENVLAIGDGENDISMVELAGLGVAVGNGHDGLKESADHVVASNDDDGVAEALERFVLGTSVMAGSSSTSSTENRAATSEQSNSSEEIGSE